MAFYAIARPLSESSKWIMLDSNQRVINDGAERILKLGGRGRILTYESTGLQPEPLNTLVPDHKLL